MMRWRQPKAQLKALWRQLLRLERPRQQPAVWRPRDTLSVALVCVLAALLASWPLLVEPSITAGMPAPSRPGPQGRHRGRQHRA